MHFENLSLQNFKNFEQIEFDFCEGINCFVGANGVGKTNLLDALHYLSQTKSAFNAIDHQNIRRKADYFVINAGLHSGDAPKALHLSLKRGEKKVFKVNKQEYDKIRDHIGQLPVVLMTPYDTDLIREGSEVRRRFFDSLISQFDAEYLRDLMRYTQLLKQRNALLKQFAEANQPLDHDRIEPFDHAVLLTGRKLFEKREAISRAFQPLFEGHYTALTQGREHATFVYKSDLAAADFEETYRANRQRDLLMQRTTLGVHKDDYVTLLDEQSVKKFGSQGQQKSYVIAMKLAQFDLIKARKGEAPVLLLDDIFDKLDDGRIGRLMDLVAGNQFGQLFVTDARPERTMQLFGKLDCDMFVFEVKSGTATKL